MAYSTQRAVSDGTMTYLDLSIGYQSRDDIKVFFNDLPAPAGSWAWVGTTDKRISFTPAVPNGTEVLVQRSTRLDRIINVFALGAKFNNTTMDQNFLQVLYLTQEAVEGSALSDIYNDVDFHGYKIKNIGNATADNEAVTFGQMKTINQSAYQAMLDAQAARDKAKQWASQATTPVEGSLYSAYQYALNSKASADASEASRQISDQRANASAASAAAALASQNAALASQNATKTSETNAKTSETNAKTSETNAKASEIAAAASAGASDGFKFHAFKYTAGAYTLVGDDIGCVRQVGGNITTLKHSLIGNGYAVMLINPTANVYTLSTDPANTADFIDIGDSQVTTLNINPKQWLIFVGRGNDGINIVAGDALDGNYARANNAVTTANAAKTTADAALPKAGGIMTGQIDSTTQDFFRARNGNYGVIFRNDGGRMWFLQTASGNQGGTWNNYRPFSWDLTNGNTYFNDAGFGQAYFGNAINTVGQNQFKASGATAGEVALWSPNNSYVARLRGRGGGGIDMVNNAYNAVVWGIDDGGTQRLGGGGTIGTDGNVYWTSRGWTSDLWNRADDAWNKANDAQVNRADRGATCQWVSGVDVEYNFDQLSGGTVDMPAPRVMVGVRKNSANSNFYVRGVLIKNN